MFSYFPFGFQKSSFSRDGKSTRLSSLEASVSGQMINNVRKENPFEIYHVVK